MYSNNLFLNFTIWMVKSARICFENIALNWHISRKKEIVEKLIQSAIVLDLVHFITIVLDLVHFLVILFSHSN